MFMIPDNVLETLICRNCKNYLSARPVKVYPNRHILCGRCSNDNDDGVVSIYDAVAQQGLFKCINRYEGCDKVLKYTDVLDHEKTCLSPQYKCPFCTCPESKGSLAFLNHCKENHKGAILLTPSFEISNFGRKFLKTFLYVMNSYIFFIQILLFRAVDHTQFISLNAILLGPRSVSDKIYQKYVLHILNNGIKGNKQVTKRTLCSPYSNKLKNKIIIANYGIEPNQTLAVEFEIDIRNVQLLMAMPSFHVPIPGSSINNNDVVDLTSPSCSNVQSSKTKLKFFVTDEFKRMWSSKYNLDEEATFISSLNRKIGSCCHCQNIFLCQSENQGIYKCSCAQCSNSNNLICSKCFFFGVIFCMNGNGKPYQFAVEETAVFKTVQYYCRWGCGNHLYSWFLKFHELNCVLRRAILCPVKGCDKKLSGEILIKHIQDHPGVMYQEDSLVSTNLFLNEGKNCLVLPIQNHLITMTWNKILSNTFSCSLFNSKNTALGNLQPRACLGDNKKIVSFKDIFTVDIVDQNAILIILVNSS